MPNIWSLYHTTHWLRCSKYHVSPLHKIRVGFQTQTIWFSREFDRVIRRAALTTHELEWLDPSGKLAELELKCSNRELVYFGNTNVTQST